MPRPVRRLAQIASWLMVSAAILIAGSFVVLTAGFDWEFSTVLTGSMAPKYPVGSMVVIVPVPPADLAVGDVITFKSDGRRISHRVTSIKNGPSGRLFTTKGDANNVADQTPVPEQNVVGRVKTGLPWLGTLLLWMRSPLGMGITASLCAGSLFFGAANRKHDAGERKPTNA